MSLTDPRVFVTEPISVSGPAASPRPSPIRFGVFEVDLSTGELRKSGLKIRLEGQPLQILKMLLERAGQVVTREELKQNLWPADTFVDFEVGINAAVKRLRQALDDSADTPRFIETLPRRGYRFIYPVNGASAEILAMSAASRRRPLVWLLSGLALLLVAVVALGVAWRDNWPLHRAVGAPIRSIAVLPLENLTGDTEQEYFVDGIHEELTTHVAQMSAFEKVISRTSAVQYKGTKKSLREITRELKVDGILEGGVLRAGEKVRVTVQLIAAPDDRHVWAQTFERDLRDASALPAEIAGALAVKLGVALTPQEQSRLTNTKPVDQAAYEAYFKGMYHAGKWTNEGLWQAIRHFQEALDLDPTYAPAWAGLGAAYEQLSGGSKRDNLSTKDALARAKEALARAVELDPALREPHQVLGRIKLREWDWEGQEKEFQRAKELDPNWRGGSFYFVWTGRFDDAVAAQRRAVDLDPLGYNTQLVLGWTYFMTGRYDESIAQLKKTIELDPRIHSAYFELAWNYAKKGMHAEAISACETSLALLRKRQPEAFAAQGCGCVYALAGRRREALEIARRFEKAPPGNQDFIQLAHIYDALGDRNRALAFLYKAYELRAALLPRQWMSPMLSDEMKADPRFQELIRRTGIPWAKFKPAADSVVATRSKP